MHAVLVKVSISDVENAQKELRETVVPRVSQLPGFVAGYWTRSADGSNGRSMIVFESEEAARTAAERIGANVPEGVTFESAEVREVVANAQLELRGVLLQEHEWRRKEGLVQLSYQGGVPIDDEEFESLLEQVRGLHRQADKITRETGRLQANVQARLSWERDPPPLAPAQREIADEAIELLGQRQLSSTQSRALRRAFFGRRQRGQRRVLLHEPEQRSREGLVQSPRPTRLGDISRAAQDLTRWSVL